ncbi:MAG: dicarboxylate/amino acid:cation symporter, partial [Gammaproteobacteria bacterium]|nr:dicarboxylate/amino acid:cation symporter [Gammaproteobacteria bacterium]
MKLKLHWQIAIAIVGGGLMGWLTGDTAAIFGVLWYDIYDFFGTLFLNALKMLIVPLISASIIVGVAGLGSSGNIGRLGGKTLGFYVMTTLSAVLVGLVILNIVRPGELDGEPVREILALELAAGEVSQQVTDKGAGDIVQVLLRAVPPNIIQAASEGQLLGIIVFCLLFGFFMTRLEHVYAETLMNFWTGVFQVMMRMTEWVMLFAPIGVFALVARVVARTGFDAAGPLLLFAGCVLAGLAVHAFITLPLLLRFVARLAPLKFMQQI